MREIKWVSFAFRWLTCYFWASFMPAIASLVPANYWNSGLALIFVGLPKRAWQAEQRQYPCLPRYRMSTYVVFIKSW